MKQSLNMEMAIIMARVGHFLFVELLIACVTLYFLIPDDLVNLE